LAEQFVALALAPTEFVQEILKVTRWRLFVAFQPKEVRDMIVVNGVHANAETLACETNFIWPR
jgi:hypothetical protein